MKIILPLLGLLLPLTACNKGIQDKDAVRQGVLDYLAGRPGLSMGGMTVDVTNVTFKDGKAEAEVSFTAKGAQGGAGGMTMRYTLEQKENKWVVVGKADSGKSPHGGGMPGMTGADQGTPGMANPHGGAMVDTERPGGMPPGHPPAGGKKSGDEKK